MQNGLMHRMVTLLNSVKSPFQQQCRVDYDQNGTYVVYKCTGDRILPAV